MEEILAGHERAVFVCGIAWNQGELLDLFDRVFLLHIDEATREARLAVHDALHRPGPQPGGPEEDPGGPDRVRDEDAHSGRGRPGRYGASGRGR
jgi:hypothetical protein